MPFEDLIIGFICGAAGSLVLWVTIGRRMMLKYAGISVARALADPDSEMKEALDGVMSYLWGWLNTPSIEVNGTPDEEGKPTKAIISPLQNVLSTMIDSIVLKVIGRIRGTQGAVQRDANRMQADLSGLMGIPIPRKGQSTGEFLVEQLAQRLMPMIDKKAEELISKKGENQLGGMLR